MHCLERCAARRSRRLLRCKTQNWTQKAAQRGAIHWPLSLLMLAKSVRTNAKMTERLLRLSHLQKRGISNRVRPPWPTTKMHMQIRVGALRLQTINIRRMERDLHGPQARWTKALLILQTMRSPQKEAMQLERSSAVRIQMLTNCALHCSISCASRIRLQWNANCLLRLRPVRNRWNATQKCLQRQTHWRKRLLAWRNPDFRGKSHVCSPEQSTLKARDGQQSECKLREASLKASFVHTCAGCMRPSCSKKMVVVIVP